MENEKQAIVAAAAPQEEPQATLTRLVHVVPSTSVFAGWGPRMETSLRDIMRGRN